MMYATILCSVNSFNYIRPGGFFLHAPRTEPVRRQTITCANDHFFSFKDKLKDKLKFEPNYHDKYLITSINVSSAKCEHLVKASMP